MPAPRTRIHDGGPIEPRESNGPAWAGLKCLHPADISGWAFVGTRESNGPVWAGLKCLHLAQKFTMGVPSGPVRVTVLTGQARNACTVQKMHDGGFVGARESDGLVWAG